MALIMSPPDLDQRADRAKQIAQELFGKSHWRDGAEMHVEIPADMAGAAASSYGRGGFSAVITGQTTRLAPRRIVDMDQRTIVTDEQALMAFYSFKVDLHDRHAKVTDTPHAGAIAATRPVKPAGG
jgi:hypothetical protein